jgi:two-component system, LytTR family, response regulator
MIRTVLVDDESRLLSSLQTMLKKNCPQLDVVAVCRSADEALIKIKETDPELVFLDIAMPGKDGFALLNEIGDIRFRIIFVSAHDAYSLRAFKFSTVDYLLKPVDEDELVAAVKKAEQTIFQEQTLRKSIEALMHNLKPQTNTQEKKLCLVTLTGFHVVSLTDIIYCEAEGPYTNFHLLDNKKVCVSRPLVDFELLLIDDNFLRVHKSFLINLHHTREYRRGEGGVVILSNGAEIDVSRRKKDIFLEKIKDIFKH